MEKPIIEVKNIGKRYKITHERGKYVALRDVLANIFKHPFAFLADKAKSATGLKKKDSPHISIRMHVLYTSDLPQAGKGNFPLSRYFGGSSIFIKNITADLPSFYLKLCYN